VKPGMRVTILPVSGRPYRMTIPVDEQELADAVMGHLVLPNVSYLREHGAPRFLDMARSGRIVYGRDPDELWATIPWCISMGVIDCEDAAAWLTADDRVYEGIDSYAGVYHSRPGGPYHVIVARPGPASAGEIAIGNADGMTLIDAARMIGMGTSRTYPVQRRF